MPLIMVAATIASDENVFIVLSFSLIRFRLE